MEWLKKKWRQNVGIITNILSFVVIYLISNVIGVIDHRFTEPNEMAKIIKLESLIPVIAVSGFFMTLVKRNVKFTLLDLLALLFLAYWLISVYVRGIGDPKHFLLPVALTAIYIFVRASISDGGDSLKWVALPILCVSIVELILGMKQIYGFASSNHFQYPVTGSFFNPGPFGGYLAFIFALSLSLVIKLRNKGEKILIAVKQGRFKDLLSIDVPLYLVSFTTFILSFILLPATMSRSAWMAVCLVSLLAFFELGLVRKIQRRLSDHKRFLIPAVLMAAILTFAAIFAVYSLKKGSADARLFSWRISAGIIAENPITGVGVGYFGGAYANRQAQFFAENPDSEYMSVADCPSYAFNEYLQIGSELGLPVLVLFIIVAVLALWSVFKKPGPFHYGILALLVFAFTSYPLHLVPLLILFVISLAAQESMPLTGRLTVKLLFTILLIVVFIAWTGSRQLILNHIKAQTEWGKLKKLYDRKFYDADGYEEYYSILKYDYKFLFEYGHSLNKVGEHERSNEILNRGAEYSNDPMFHNIMGNNYLAMLDYERAEKSYKTANAIVPNRIYPLYLLAKLYIKQGDNDKALNMCRKVIEFEPKVHSPAIKEIKDEIERLMLKLLNH